MTPTTTRKQETSNEQSAPASAAEARHWDVVVFVDPDEHEVLRFPLGDAPIPIIGDTIWFEGELSGNGYQVIHRSIEFDKHQVTLVVKL